MYLQTFIHLFYLYKYINIYQYLDIDVSYFIIYGFLLL